MFTAWGYEVDSSIPPLLSADAFNSMTGGKYAGDLRAASALNAASQAVRNFCGWHVSPVLKCTYMVPSIGDDDGRAVRKFTLPSMAIASVESVTELGVPLGPGEYEWMRNGMMRRACFKCWPTSWNAVKVEYKAGYDAAVTPDLAEAVRSIAEGVLAVSAGVMSESADGVSISYSANASSIAAALTEQQRTALMPYRLVSAHAA